MTESNPIASGKTAEVAQVQIPIPDVAAKVTRKSFQLRALFRKALTYQKRQVGVNICCVLLCPALMVILAYAAVFIVLDAFKRSATSNMVAYYRYCSNESDYINTNGFPLQFRNWSDVTNPANKDKIFNLNYYALKVNSTAWPCINWFEDDTSSTPPYSVDSSRTLDTTFLVEPRDGWFNASYKSVPRYLSDAQYQAILSLSASNASATGSNSVLPTPIYSSIGAVSKYPWNYVYVSSGVDAGTNPQGPSVASVASFPARGSEPGKSGFLGKSITQYYQFVAVNSTSAQYLPADFFVPITGNDPDAFLLEKLNEVVLFQERAFLPTADDNGKLVYRTPSNPDLMALLSVEQMQLRYPFYGAVYINALDKTKPSMDVTLQAGRTPRLESTLAFSNANLSLLRIPIDPNSVYPPQGFRFVYQLTRLTNSLLQSSTQGSAASTVITHGLRVFPDKVQYDVNTFPVDVTSELGKIMYPFGLSFLLPIFVLMLVREKEDRIYIMLRMNGLSTATYYVSHYIHCFVMQLLNGLVFLLVGTVMRQKFFTETGPGVVFITLLLWTNVCVAFAFFLSLFFNKSRFALITTFVLVVVSCMINVNIGLIFNYESPPAVWFVWPLWAFYRSLELIGTASSSITRSPYQLSDLRGSDELLVTWLFMLFEGIILLLLTAYLHLVLPSEFGIQRPWYFPITYLKKWLVKSNPNKVGQETALEVQKKASEVDDYLLPEDNLELLEDSDVKAERSKVMGMKLNEETFKKYPLLIRNIRKKYATGKIANKAMCLAVEEHIVFGLLGPNGAGKSTLISMMTGIYPPSSGTAYAAGFDIRRQMDQVYLNVGVCPQHDILWEDLTVEEHLLFYGRLRGVTAAEESEKVTAVLQSVKLEPFRNRLTKGLSGGEKRRLSIAIALIGDVPLVFLDEPTTGLDPEVRRNIWDIIQTAKHDKTIILTTHSMEEADILSTRIGIMAKGVLRCLGTPLHLKRRYGRGFKLNVSFKKGQDFGVADPYKDARAKIESILPEGQWRQLQQGGVTGSVTYEFDDQEVANENEEKPKEGVISRLLEQLELIKKDLDVIEDWGISQTSLEEVFLNIVKDEDADATDK